MINNTNTSSTNVVIPVSTKDNSGYIITTEVKSNAGPGGSVLVTTKEEIRLLITNQTSEYICIEQPKIHKCAPPNNFTFPTVIFPICSKPTKICNTPSNKNISTQTNPDETGKEEKTSEVNANCPCSKKENISTQTKPGKTGKEEKTSDVNFELSLFQEKETDKKKEGKPKKPPSKGASKPKLKKKQTKKTLSKPRSKSVSSSCSCSDCESTTR